MQMRGERLVLRLLLSKGDTMNKVERRERFTELMTTIELLGNQHDEDYDPKFPRGSYGLSDGNLKTAVMAQAMRESDEFVGNLINALANTGLGACVDANERDEQPSEDDLSCATLAVHVAWAKGAFMPMAYIMGTIAKMIEHFDLDVPDDLTLILRSNAGMQKKAQQFDPITLLDMTTKDLKRYIEQGLSNDD
jgi:hypothetical protein